jgi:hypothetical protein
MNRGKTNMAVPKVDSSLFPADHRAGRSSFKRNKMKQYEIDKLTKKQMSLIITSALFNMPIENFKSVQERHAKSLARLRKSELIEWVIKALKVIAQREENQLHAAVVELVAYKDAEIK